MIHLEHLSALIVSYPYGDIMGTINVRGERTDYPLGAGVQDEEIVQYKAKSQVRIKQQSVAYM